jgi:hypothetical protein
MNFDAIRLRVLDQVESRKSEETPKQNIKSTMMATPRQVESALSEPLPVAGNKRQRPEPQQQQEPQQQKRSSGASLPTTGYNVALL